MNCTRFDEETRRHIGDMILGIRGLTAPISVIAESVGTSRVTLSKLLRSDYHLWELTRHISDRDVMRLSMHTPDSRESRFLFHAQAFASRVTDIRSDAAKGILGAGFKAMEEERKRSENANA